MFLISEKRQRIAKKILLICVPDGNRQRIILCVPFYSYMKSYIILFVPKICSFATHERIVIFGTEKELNVPQGTVHSFYSKWTVRFFRKGLSFFQDKKGWLVVFSGPVKMGGGEGGGGVSGGNVGWYRGQSFGLKMAIPSFKSNRPFL